MRIISLLLLLFSFVSSYSQQTTAPQTPKLVVGIVVDQMRYDFLYRYWDKYSENGFKKLLTQGFNCSNTHFNYVPTYTAPGHASVYTGATPAAHGIIGNDWYDRATGKKLYCVTDTAVGTIGSSSLNSGKKSPKQLMTTTVTDELRLSSNFKSKVISISIKDRGAILPGGHAANGAYWYDDDSGNMISSTHYMKEIPAWAKAFNDKKHADKYLSSPWKTLLPIDQYTESIPDDNKYEGLLATEKKPVFPHNLPAEKKLNGYIALRKSPFGSTLTKDFAIEALRAENLGKGNVPDFLAVSFSSPDYVGHFWGPQSIEIEDTYLRLDQDIAALLTYIEAHVGKENVLIFLTADHGVIPVPAYLKDNKLPGSSFESTDFVKHVNAYMSKSFGTFEWVRSFSNSQLFLNYANMDESQINPKDFQDAAIRAALSFPGVTYAYSAVSMMENSFYKTPGELIQNGFYPRRSGDVMVVLEPGAIEAYSITGTTHGTHYSYDTHVPLIWYGWKVKQGSSTERVNITDIAPTVSGLLNIPFPSGSTGNPINLLLK